MAGKITLGGPARKLDGVTSKVLVGDLTGGKVKGAPLAHVSREIIRRQAAGKLADGSLTAAAVKRLVADGTIPSQSDCRKHLDALAANRKNAAKN